MSKQIRQMKRELREQFIDMIGGMPELTKEQRKYITYVKTKAIEILDVDTSEISHLEQEEEK